MSSTDTFYGRWRKEQVKIPQKQYAGPCPFQLQMFVAFKLNLNHFPFHSMCAGVQDCPKAAKIDKT